jgi:hypothetical protein
MSQFRYIHSVWPASQSFNGPKLYGSDRASNFVKDLASGKDSLDIVFVGDSNTMSAVAGAWGYHNGISEAMNARGWACYGTAVYPTMTGWTGAGAAYSLGGWRSSCYLANPTGNLASGNTSGGGTSYQAWTPGSNWTRYGSFTASPPAKDDWAYIASGTYSDNYNAVEMFDTHPLNSNSLTLHHRIIYGTFTFGTGSFRGRTRAYSSGTVYATGPSQTTLGSSYSVNAYEYSFTPQGLYLNSSWSGPTATGPCAILSHSIYCKRKGWSVTSHGYISGGDSATIASVITGAGNKPLQNQLEELRARQRLATGTGRVLIVAHSGINGADTPTTWTTAHQNIWNTYKDAWKALGFPEEDLAMISFVGVQRNSADTSNDLANLAAVRDAAKTFGMQANGLTVADMPSIITYAELIGPPYLYQSASVTVHLSGGSGSTTDGYREVSNRLLTALLA